MKLVCIMFRDQTVLSLPKEISQTEVVQEFFDNDVCPGATASTSM